MTSFSVSIQMKATEQYSPVVLFIMLYTVVLVIMKKKKTNKQNKTKQMVPVLYQNHAIMPPRHSIYHGLCPFQL